MSRMLEEIRQQPDALARTLSAELRRVERFRRVVARKRPRLVVLVARGTSDNAALFGRYLVEITTGIPVSLAAPSIATLYEAPMHYRDALVVAISQSGESTDTNLVLERARQSGAITLGITNESGSRLANIAEHLFLVRAGREKSVAATKTYTGQMLAMYLLAYALGGGVRIAELERLPELVAAALQLEPEMDALSERYRFMKNAVVVGRGLNYANAFEFSLKLMETCYVVAERFSSADFQHGPIALVEQGFPVFAFTPPGKTWPSHGRDADQAPRIARGDRLHCRTRQSRGGAVLHQSHPRAPAFEGTADADPLHRSRPVVRRMPGRKKGLDPDKPRTLSKVTRTM